MTMYRCLLLLLLFFVPGEVCDVEDSLNDLNAKLTRLTHQVMMQQMQVDESKRATYDSGLLQLRRRSNGPESYNSETHAGGSIAAMHNHANNIRTVGMGDFVAVMNGYEFRTRHNDYGLKMASTTGGEYHATEPVPFPDVPPEVLAKTKFEDQVTEMREWFKAWKEQDFSVRDYRKYFKPILCYLEGAWISDDSFDEPFDSDRHFLDAASWQQLLDQLRFTSTIGTKNLNENLAFLATAIFKGANDTFQFAQWNYRILCHPLKGDLSLSHLQPVDHLANRLHRKKTFDQHVASRSARFRVVSPSDTKYWTLLDDMMYQVPGMNNYPGNLTEELFQQVKKHVLTDNDLNTAYYLRAYSTQRRDANGEAKLFTGYADKFLFVAETTQPRVATVTYPFNCRTSWQRRSGQCKIYSRKASYAIPLEIIFLTPLHSWNPRGLEYKGLYNSPEGKTVYANRRNGGSISRAYNGTNSKMFYQTPFEFFSGGAEVDRDSADTTRGLVWVMAENGTVYKTSSTGVRIHLPSIPGLGVLRTRYPIMPVAVEGNSIWKELAALNDVVLDMKTHLNYFRTSPPLPEQALHVYDPTATHAQLVLTSSRSELLEGHEHVVKLSAQNVTDLYKNNKTMLLYTTTSQGHYHQLIVDYNERDRRFEYRLCDGNCHCFDRHHERLEYQRL